MFKITNNYLYLSLSSGEWYTIEDDLPSSKLALAYKESFQFNEVNGELTSILDQAMKGSKDYTQYATDFLWQVFLSITTGLCIYVTISYSC